MVVPLQGRMRPWVRHSIYESLWAAGGINQGDLTAMERDREDQPWFVIRFASSITLKERGCHSTVWTFVCILRVQWFQKYINQTRLLTIINFRSALFLGIEPWSTEGCWPVRCVPCTASYALLHSTLASPAIQRSVFSSFWLSRICMSSTGLAFAIPSMVGFPVAPSPVTVWLDDDHSDEDERPLASLTWIASSPEFTSPSPRLAVRKSTHAGTGCPVAGDSASRDASVMDDVPGRVSGHIF